jgi:CHAT domain-containing protein
MRFKLLSEKMAIAMAMLFLILNLHAQNKQDTLTAFRHYSMAVAFTNAEKSDSAAFHFLIASAIYKQNGCWHRAARCYNTSSMLHYNLGHFEEAMTAARQVLALVPGKIASNDLEVGRAWRNFMRAKKITANYDSAFYAQQLALPIYESVLTDSSAELADFYMEISQIYAYRLDYDRAIRYRLKALHITIKAYGNRHMMVARVYHNLAYLYSKTGQHQKALEHVGKSIEILKYDGDKASLAYAYNMMGEIYIEIGNYEKAISNLKLAELLTPNDLHSSTYKIMIYRDMGWAYGKMKEFDLAISALNKGLPIAKSLFGEKHPAITSLYTYRGIALLGKGLKDEALQDFQRSIIANSKQFNDLDLHALPTAKDMIDALEGIPLLNDKAMVLHERYEKSKDIGDLQTSLRTYELLDTIVNTTRISRAAHVDKIRLGDYHNEIYEGGIKACLDLYGITSDKNYLRRAFYFSENNKSMILRETISEQIIKEEANVPTELSDFEKKLNDEITLLRSKIQVLKLQHNKTSSLGELENELFKTEISVDSLKRKLEHDYPKYYRLKYHNALINLDTLQKNIPENTLVLQYFEGSENIYLFRISSGAYDVSVRSRHANYDSLHREFDESIRTSVGMLYSEAGYKRFAHSSHGLFSLLLKDAIKNLPIKNIVIIPDGKLSYLPFEILLMEKPEGTVGNYSSLSYLLTKYSITYGYSATLHFNRNRSSRDGDENGILSFAPDYDNFDKLSNKQTASLGKFRNAITALKWNEHEIASIHNFFKGDAYPGSKATERRFKQLAGKYAVIHLAMHALLDDAEPMNSRLVFSQNIDGAEDGYLYAFELYGMQLNARMVVLSACNTAYGELANGEGVMSLGRAFAYAGVPSVVMSHWKVDDEATSVLMEYFYKHLSEGMNKSEALRMAKLNYLEKADPAKIHPFYWGAFVTTGDDSPLIIPPRDNYLVIGAIVPVIFAIAVTGFWLWKSIPQLNRS